MSTKPSELHGEDAVATQHENSSVFLDLLTELSWKEKLAPEFEKDYMRSLWKFLRAEYAHDKTIFPLPSQIFSALNTLAFEHVKVVILGQDPYHGLGQAHGLSFSVPDNQVIPPSLRNIYKEIENDLGLASPSTGDLYSWAEQGVLLLNSVLTVEHAKPNSHQGMGWEMFTDKIIERLNEETEHLVFMLWGNYAQKKGAFINTRKHLVLTAAHPSPLSAYRGFLGCRHFSKTNHYLCQHQKQAISW